MYQDLMGRDKKVFWNRRGSVIKAHMLLLAHLERLGEDVPPALQVRGGCVVWVGGGRGEGRALCWLVARGGVLLGRQVRGWECWEQKAGAPLTQPTLPPTHPPGGPQVCASKVPPAG